MPGLCCTECSEARSSSSTAATGRLLQARHGAARGLEPVEQDQRARLVRVLLDGPVGDLADEAERPSEPIIRWARMSTGSLKSTSAFRL
jgi:hypothetical protein